MTENKYRPYTSQEPTEGNPSTRSYKRREWKNSWANLFLAKRGGMNFEREFRRELWRESWIDFNLSSNDKIVG